MDSINYNYIQQFTIGCSLSSHLHNHPNMPIFSNRLQFYKNRLANYVESSKKPQKVLQNAKEKEKINFKAITSNLGLCFNLIDDFKKASTTLFDNLHNLSDAEWNDQLNEKILQKTDQLLKHPEIHLNESILNKYQKVIERRKHKRQNIKKCKQQATKIKRIQSANTKRKNNEIDQLLNKNVSKNLEDQPQTALKQRVAKLLADVNRRKKDAANHIKMFDSLRELCRLRNPHSDNPDFNQEMIRLKEIWENAHNEYEKEEKNLRDLIEKNAVLDDWKIKLFGNLNEENAPKLKDLIKIRNSWDQFIVPNDNPFGSAIPMGFVMPVNKF